MTDPQAMLDFQCVVNANEFWRASLNVSVDPRRNRLRGVRIEPCAIGGVTLTATDGHTLVTIHDVEGFATRADTILLNEAMLLACKSPALNLLAVNCGRGSVVSRNIVSTSGKSEPEIRDLALGYAALPAVGKVEQPQWVTSVMDALGYPDWRIVLRKPRPDCLAGASFNPKLLRRVSRSVCQQNGEPIQIIPMGGGTLSEPHYVVGEPRHRIGVIMPMRRNIDLMADGLPPWLAIAEAEDAP